MDEATHILTMMDAGLCFLLAMAIPDKMSETVARTVVQRWVCPYGTPLCIYTDQGCKFTGKHFQHLMRVEGIATKMCLPYAHHANPIEQVHQTLQGQLRILRHPGTSSCTASLSGTLWWERHMGGMKLYMMFSSLDAAPGEINSAAIFAFSGATGMSAAAPGYFRL